MEDWQLLREYAAGNSESAFRTLVERHLGLVRSAALRQVRDARTADEVSQAVFILLARKAGSLGRDVVLSGWLYRTTRFVASRALRSELRRQRREEEAFNMQQLSSPDDAWRRVESVLDEAMEKLGELDRNAVILRFFEDQPLAQVGNELGISEEAAKKRVARALEKLRGFFAGRGFVVTGTVLGAALAAHSVGAAPVGMSGSVAAGALAHGGAAAAAGLPALVRETINAWRWAKIKLVGGAALAGLTAALILQQTVVSGNKSAAVIPTPTLALNAVEAAPKGEAKAEVAEGGQVAADARATKQTQDSPHLLFRVVDAETSTGIAKAKVYLTTGKDWGNIKTRTDLATDKDGVCDIPLPYADPQLLFVGALADGYVQKCFVWGGPQKEPQPKEHTLKLERGGTIGGVVQDEWGTPIPDAEIFVQFMDTGDASWREFQAERHGFPAEDLPSAKTDAKGQWSFGSASKQASDFFLNVKHSGFPDAGFQPDGGTQSFLNSHPVSSKDLFAGKAVMVLSGGLKISGTVVDDRQRPVAGAKVEVGHFAGVVNASATTAVDGSFAAAHLSPEQNYLTVTAKGFSPERIEVLIASNLPPMKIELKPGALLRLRVVDESGANVIRARVALEKWDEQHNALEWSGITDDNGRLEWTDAPRGALTFFAHRDGYFYSRDNPATADGEEHFITLHPQVVVSGKVTDADSGQPIAAFKVIPGADPNSREWERSDLVNGTNGEYELTFHEFRPPLMVRVEAAGYGTAVSQPLQPEVTNQTCDFKLKKASPEAAVRGVVLLPDGGPARGAAVALCTMEKGVTLEGGVFRNRNRGDAKVVEADESGHFAFAPDAEAHTVVAVHEQGFARVRLTGTNQVLEVQLKPWGRVEGTLQLRGQSNVGKDMTLYDQASPNYKGSLSLNYYAKTDGQGNFVFKRVPPGEFAIFYVAGLGIPYSYETPVDILPGETAHVEVTSTGRTLTGRLAAEEGKSSADWSKAIQFANLGTKPVPMPHPEGMSLEGMERWKVEFWQSKEGRAYLRAMRSYPPKVEADGSFTVENVPAGEYQFMAILKNNTSVMKEIVVPEGDEKTEAMDVGVLTVK